MPVIDVTKDIATHTLTITAQFAAPVSRVWQIYADPSQLAAIWGPPGFPTTVVEHSLAPGGRVHYFMTGPDGERYHGFWRVTDVDEPNVFTFEDGFAQEDFSPVPDMPVSTNVYTFTANDDGTRVVYTTTYDSAEALQTVLDMGMEEGATQAINQIDDLVAA